MSGNGQGAPSPTPNTEHAKLAAVASESQALGEFLDWLTATKHVVFSEWHTTHNRGWNFDELRQMLWDTTTLLAEYFEIDTDKLEAEKLAALDALRDSHREAGFKIDPGDLDP